MPWSLLRESIWNFRLQFSCFWRFGLQALRLTWFSVPEIPLLYVFVGSFRVLVCVPKETTRRLHVNCQTDYNQKLTASTSIVKPYWFGSSFKLFLQNFYSKNWNPTSFPNFHYLAYTVQLAKVFQYMNISVSLLVYFKIIFITGYKKNNWKLEMFSFEILEQE